MQSGLQSRVTPVLVARASRPAWRGHPARAMAGAGRPSDSGRDGRATAKRVTLAGFGSVPASFLTEEVVEASAQFGLGAGGQQWTGADFC